MLVPSFFLKDVHKTEDSKAVQWGRSKKVYPPPTAKKNPVPPPTPIYFCSGVWLNWLQVMTSICSLYSWQGLLAYFTEKLFFFISQFVYPHLNEKHFWLQWYLLLWILIARNSLSLPSANWKPGFQEKAATAVQLHASFSTPQICLLFSFNEMILFLTNDRRELYISFCVN